ncbi:MAG: hypothetical protein WDA09_03065 [Bacteriovoracaceae bacterium]
MSNPFFVFTTFIVLSLSFNSFSDRELIKDLPPITSETIRWNMPADIWLYGIPAYLMKGKLYRVDEIEGVRGVSIFDNPKLTGESFQVVSNFELEKKGESVCKNFPYERGEYKAEDAFICFRYSCQSFKEAILDHKNLLINSNGGSDSNYLTQPERFYGNCPYKLDYYYHLFVVGAEEKTIYTAFEADIHDNKQSSLYFRYEDIDKEENYLVVNVNGKKHYADIRRCKKNPSKCGKVNIKYSEFERDWMKMKQHQKNKDLDDLNLLIKELKPCVMKRDIACIKKYVANKETDEGMEHGEYYYIALDINEKSEDLFKELEACLSYDKLLPHLYGMRGIDKVCLFQFRLTGPSPEKTRREEKYGKRVMRIMGVAYPEAVRINSPYTIHYIRK